MTTTEDRRTGTPVEASPSGWPNKESLVYTVFTGSGCQSGSTLSVSVKMCLNVTVTVCKCANVQGKV